MRSYAPQAEVYQVNYMNPFLPEPDTCGSLSPTIAASDFIHDTGLYAALMGTPLAGLIDCGGRVAGALADPAGARWVTDHFMSQLDDEHQPGRPG